jgi:benzoylformate decarboxylase
VTDLTTVRAATHALMREKGMTTVFGNPGSTELRMFRDWPADFRYVLALQESSAIAMADGYAQVTGNAAFVNLHSAVGVGHALGSIFTAMRNATPLVITAGQQTRAMLATEPYLFAEDPTVFPRPYVKWASEPARAQDVPGALHRAYHQAMARPRGPVFVSIPEDDWDASCEPVAARTVHGQLGADVDALSAVLLALRAARRPCLVVGAGVDRDGAWSQTVALAERLGATVWAAPLSSRSGFPEDHAAFAGFLVPARAKLASQLAGHDVIVVLGAPVFTYHVPSEGPFVPDGATLFQLTDDPAAAARASAGTAIVCSLGPALTQLLDRLPDNGRAVSPTPARPAAPAPAGTDPIRAEYVMAAVRALMPSDAIVVEEAPTHRNAMHDHLPITTPGGFFVAASGGLGWGLPAAVGVALGAGGRRVVCLLGEGSSMYSIQALYTAVQQGLPVAFVVLDNHAYVALKALGAAIDIPDPPGVDLPGLDVVAIAAGFGCPVRRVERADDVHAALAEAFTAEGPTLTAVTVDPALEPLY